MVIGMPLFNHDQNGEQFCNNIRLIEGNSEYFFKKWIKIGKSKNSNVLSLYFFFLYYP